MVKELAMLKTENTDPRHNLALERYLTMHTKEGECILYLWQNRKTVVIGRNQNAWKECRADALTRDGGFLVRRLSGGGAVFHDLGNLNFTFCVRKENYDLARQLEVILRAVRKFGIQAEKTGRNDITVDGRKFSGNAFFESGDFCYHHGTIMVRVDTDRMTQYLNVPEDKLRSKGVASVRARVVNLSELCPEITVPLLSEKLRESFGEVYGLPVRTMSEEQLDGREIGEWAERFSSWDWIFGRRIPFTNEVSRRFSWGNADLALKVNGGRIEACRIWSDAMDEEKIRATQEALTGCRYDRTAMAEALQSDPALRSAPGMREDLSILTEELFTQA